MQTRRNFIGNVATGLGSLATGQVLGANERIRFGVIGVGERGTAIAREALACPNAECVAFADVYTRRLEDAKLLAPEAKSYLNYRQLLEDPSIDAVLIATPLHLHAECFIAAMNAGKHVYQEKTMAFTVEDAQAMRAAWLAASPRRTVQIGHQALSSGQVADASNFFASGAVGKVTAIQGRMFRNTPHGKPQWARPVFPDMTPENLIWKAFLGGAPERDFDPDRYANWRLFWDYSGGSVHENMCQQIAFWYKVMGLRIPRAVSMSGGVYLWKDGREVPDTMHVSMEHEEEILFSWDSGFGNSHPGVTEEVLGTDGTIVRGQQIRCLPQKVNRPDGMEVLGRTPAAPQAHMRNFFDCMRTGRETNCPFEVGYRVSIACRMAIASYWSGRIVRWDAEREEIL
jgi:predicted dehydrogenase